MQQLTTRAQPKSSLERLITLVVQALISLFVPVLTFLVLYAGFRFLRESDAPKGIIALVAIIWGVGGVALLYLVSNWFIERMGDIWRARLQPFVFVGPAVAILAWYLALPTVRTFWVSLFDRNGTAFVGLSNYLAVFTNRDMFTAFRNNLMWIIIGATFCVVFGLLIAALADRSRFENFAKAMIFLPMAISMVGAGVIWNMIYDVNPNIGLLNAIVGGLTGAKPVAWTAAANLQPWNNLFLILIVIWLQTGYAMVLFSAALKGIPGEIMEAARVDGATEIQVFLRIMIPYIMGTIISVGTTVVIFTLKIFDVVQVMTGGQFSTQVIATEFYRQSFTAQNAGYGSAIAIVLLIAVIPVMIYNLRQFSQREVF
ncbi:MAG: sugar ABC transporter permease [Anaerolineae bacterium]|uniref:carbohydrate ABC transporter permease n=1 Tax=Candidatus Amarolinea dominans TaxID=3140696 RepID=UPI003134A9AC|nr:sugar ABC transporter permease [Anaerolineae bacterium]MBK9229430.1 sugar ABC transporter permease [Anaerolineae bacterium]